MRKTGINIRDSLIFIEVARRADDTQSLAGKWQ